jgi:hypothetical protein
MATHTATVYWERGQQDFTGNRYSRAHGEIATGAMRLTARSGNERRHHRLDEIA